MFKSELKSSELNTGARLQPIGVVLPIPIRVDITKGILGEVQKRELFISEQHLASRGIGE